MAALDNAAPPAKRKAEPKKQGKASKARKLHVGTKADDENEDQADQVVEKEIISKGGDLLEPRARDV